MVTPLESLKDKYMKDPEIIPEEGQSKEDLAEALAQQQIRQRRNNDRAFELLTKAGSGEIADPGGGSKEGGSAAMYRLTEFVQKPIEKTELDRKTWGEPSKKHLKIMNRPLGVLNKDDLVDIKLDAPPTEDSDEQKTEIDQIKDLRSMLDDDAIRERVDKQDEDILFPFNRYLRENDLKIDREKFMSILKDVNTIIFKFKYFFNRPRPHQYSDIDEIDNIGGKSPSYPAGHSTTGAVIAELLAEQFPEHSENLRVMGTELGYNRIIAGLHHPSDHVAGLALASQLIPLLVDVKITKSDEFMNELFKYMAHRENLIKDMTQIGTQDILDGVRIDKEKEPIEKHTEEQHEKDHRDDESDFNIDDAKQDLEDQIQQIKNKIETGDYQIEKFLTKAVENIDTNERRLYRTIVNTAQRTDNIQKNEKDAFKNQLEDYLNDGGFQGLTTSKRKKVLEQIQRHLDQEGFPDEPKKLFEEYQDAVVESEDKLNVGNLVRDASKVAEDKKEEAQSESKYTEDELMYYVNKNGKERLEKIKGEDRVTHPSQELFDNLSDQGKQEFKNNFGPDSLELNGMVKWIENWRPKTTASEQDVIVTSEQEKHREMYNQLSQDPNNLISYVTFGSMSSEIEQQRKELLANGVINKKDPSKYANTDEDYNYMHPLQALVDSLNDNDKANLIGELQDNLKSRTAGDTTAKFKASELEKIIKDNFIKNKYSTTDSSIKIGKIDIKNINTAITNSRYIASSNPLREEIPSDLAGGEGFDPADVEEAWAGLNGDVKLSKDNLSDTQTEEIKNSEFQFIETGNEFILRQANKLAPDLIQAELTRVNDLNPSEKIQAFISNGNNTAEINVNGDTNEVIVALNDFKKQVDNNAGDIDKTSQNNNELETEKITEIKNLMLDLQDRSIRADLSQEQIESYEDDKVKLISLTQDYFAEHDQFKLFQALEDTDLIQNFEVLNSIQEGDPDVLDNAFPPIEADEPTNEEAQKIVEDNKEEENSNAEENESQVPEGSFTSETFANVPTDRFTFGGGFVENSGLRHAFLGVKGAGDTMWGQWYAESKERDPKTKQMINQWKPNDGFYLINRSQDTIDRIKKGNPKNKVSPVKQMHSNRRYHLDFTADGMDEGFQFYYDRYNNGDVMDYESLMAAIENEDDIGVQEDFKELQQQDRQQKFESENYEYNDAFHGTAIDILKNADGIFADELNALETPFTKQGFTFFNDQALEAETFNNKYDEIAQELVPEWRVDDEVRKSQSTPINEEELNNEIYVRKLRNELSLDKSNLNNPIDTFIASDLHFMNHPEAANFLTGTSTKLKVDPDGNIEIDADEAEDNNINTEDIVDEAPVEEDSVEGDAVEEDAVEETPAENLDAVLDTHSEIVNNLYGMKYNPDVYSLDKFKNKLKAKHKTVDELEEHLGDQTGGTNKPKYDKFVASQQEGQPATGAEKPPVQTPPTAEETPPEQPQAPVAEASQIAREITNQVNEMPTLFNKRQDGTVATNQIANNESMMNRYRVLRSMFAVQGAHISEGGKSEFVDKNGQPITRKQIEEEITAIDPEIISKVQRDLQGINTHLPKSLQSKLVKEESRPDYFEETHIQDLQQSRTNSAQQEQVHNKTMSEIKKEGINHERFNSDLHKETQQLKEWTPASQENFMTEMNEKYAGQEGGATKSQIEKERIDRGLPPGDPRPRMVKDAKTGAVVQQGFYLWHAGTHSWVTPEYVKVHGEAAAGLPTGSAIDLTQLKDGVGLPAHVLEGTTAQKQGLVGMLHDGKKGASFDGEVSNLSMTPAMGTRDDNNNITHTDNIHQFTNDAHAAQMNVVGHFAEQQMKGSIENKSTLTDTSRGVRAYQASGTSALNRYSARFQAAGGAKGALARFTAAVLPEKLGGGFTPKQAATYSAPDFQED